MVTWAESCIILYGCDDGESEIGFCSERACERASFVGK